MTGSICACKQRKLRVDGPVDDMTSENKKENERRSLQALRGLAFAGIFLGHYYEFGWTPISVSLFFVLSGYLLSLKAGDKYDKFTIIDSVKEAVRRVSKLYPLHIAMMLLFIPILYFSGKMTAVSDMAIKIALNIVLLQSLYPGADVAASMNGVSWFLSTIMILYILYPFFFRVIRRIKSADMLKLLFAVLLFVQTLIVYFTYTHVTDSNLVIYLVHCCPLYRLFDMLYGMILGLICIGREKEQTSPPALWTLAEAAIIAVVAFLVYVWDYGCGIVYLSHAPVSPLVAMILVYLFAMRKGSLTKFLGNKVLVFLGDRSGSSFLIHYPLIVSISTFIFPHLTVLKRTIIHGILFPGSIIVTLVLAYVYDKYIAGRMRKK